MKLNLLYAFFALALGFTGIEFWCFMVLGLTVIAVVGLHQPENNAVLAR